MPAKKRVCPAGARWSIFTGMPRPKGSKNKSKVTGEALPAGKRASVLEQFEELEELAKGDEQAKRHLMKRLIDAALKDGAEKPKARTFTETVDEIVGAFRSAPGVLSAVLLKLMEDETSAKEIRKAGESGRPEPHGQRPADDGGRAQPGAVAVPVNGAVLAGAPGAAAGAVVDGGRGEGERGGDSAGDRQRDSLPAVGDGILQPGSASIGVVARPVDGEGVGGEARPPAAGFPADGARGHGVSPGMLEAAEGEDVDEPFEGEGGEIDAFA